MPPEVLCWHSGGHKPSALRLQTLVFSRLHSSCCQGPPPPETCSGSVVASSSSWRWWLKDTSPHPDLPGLPGVLTAPRSGPAGSLSTGHSPSRLRGFDPPQPQLAPSRPNAKDGQGHRCPPALEFRVLLRLWVPCLPALGGLSERRGTHHLLSKVPPLQNPARNPPSKHMWPLSLAQFKGKHAFKIRGRILPGENKGRPPP